MRGIGVARSDLSSTLCYFVGFSKRETPGAHPGSPLPLCRQKPKTGADEPAPNDWQRVKALSKASYVRQKGEFPLPKLSRLSTNEAAIFRGAPQGGKVCS
jgi:hypothetical protein